VKQFHRLTGTCNRMDYQFTKPGSRDEISLVGSVCTVCNSRFFPTRATCSHCLSRNLEMVELTRLGRVTRFTIVRQAPLGYFGPVPYVLGDVTLDDGVNVLGNLTGKAVDDWRVGDLVASYVLRLPAQRSEGATVECFSFRPRVAVDGQ
jgi:uncharacterized OB-fold protein